ncbi:MAG: cyclic-di-AMP receptor [Oscillospiraceae bacterium]|nr:cyclic-di-AMP receptor [Oscillospiraceae bacterium]
MKLVLAILNSDDAHSVITSLTRADFNVTKLATTGGFLSSGNVTVLIGLDDARLDTALELIEKHSNSRKQVIPSTPDVGMSFSPSMPVQVNVGGATVFVLNVEQFVKY